MTVEPTFRGGGGAQGDVTARSVEYIDPLERRVDGQLQHLCMHIETGVLSWRDVREERPWLADSFLEWLLPKAKT